MESAHEFLYARGKGRPCGTRVRVPESAYLNNVYVFCVRTVDFNESKKLFHTAKYLLTNNKM